MDKQTIKSFFLGLTLIACQISISSCINNTNNNNLQCNKWLSQQDSIQILTQIINNKEFLNELPKCDDTTPFVIAKNGYVRDVYNIKHKEHPLILKSLTDILYINGTYEDPVRKTSVPFIGPEILLEFTHFKIQKDSVFIQMILCRNGTHFNFFFVKDSNDNWNLNLRDIFQM